MIVNIPAQPEFDFSGYVVDLPVYTISKNQPLNIFIPQKNEFINLTRIRLKPEIFLWQQARVNIEYEIDALFAGKESPISFISASGTRQVGDLRWDIVNKNDFTLSHYFDRLYFRQGFDWGNIVIGRQRISWGTGRVWNPTDLFNPINPANYSKIEKDGADALSLTYFFGSFTDLNLVYNAANDFKNNNYGFRFRTNFLEYDAAIVGGYFDKRIVAGLDFEGSIFNAGLRGEGIISMQRDDLNNNFIKFILGTDYQITPKLYSMIEYHYNGEGINDKYRYNFLKLARGEILNLNKNYLFFSANYIFSLIFNSSLAINQNLNDGSGFVSLIVSYSFLQDLYLTLGSQLTYGKKFTEYWYYPHSIYIQAEFYF